MNTDHVLHLGDGADVPVDFGTARIVMLGKGGSGKSNGGAVIVEELVGAGITTVVLDPLGNMHGLRAAGSGDGLPIAIVGGAHGDVALDPTRAEDLAALVADGLSVVVDMSQIDRDDAMRFVAAFLPALLRAMQRTRRNVHVLLEEADTFAPETPRGKAHAAVRTATTVFARTIRNFGGGWTFSTQRPQLLAKEVIDTASVFVAMRMTGELAQAAIGSEVKSRFGKTLAATVVDEAPKLARGEAWFIADDDAFGNATPAPRKIQFRWRRTFDSTRPPRIGEAAEETRAVAAIDLDGLRAALAPSNVDVAEGDGHVCTCTTEIREVYVLDDEMHGELAILVNFPKIVGDTVRREIAEMLEKALPELEAIRPTLRIVRDRLERAEEEASLRDRAPEVYAIADQVARTAPEPKSKRTSRSAGPDGSIGATADVGKGPRAIVAALAALPGRVGTKDQVGFLAGYAPNGGSFAKYLSTARTLGLVDGPSAALRLTAAGLASLGKTLPPPATSQAIVAMWRAKLDKGPRAIYDVLIAAYPKPVAAATIGERTGYEYTGGTFQRYVSTLSTLGLAKRLRGAGIVAADALFPTGTTR